MDVTDIVGLARQGIDEHERRLATLREIERLALGLDGGPPVPAPAVELPAPEPEKPKEPPPPKPQRQRRMAAPSAGPAEERRAAILAYVREHPGCAPAEIRAATGQTEIQLRDDLFALRNGGELQAEGPSRKRQYRLTDQADAAATTATRSKPPKNLVERVREAIAADPGGLTEARLAVALGADRNEIADAAGRLLLDDEVALQPDGTYIPERGGGCMKTWNSPIASSSSSSAWAAESPTTSSPTNCAARRGRRPSRRRSASSSRTSASTATRAAASACRGR